MQEMKWGCFVKQSGKWGVFFCKKKVDLASTQSAFCTVTVFFILHFTYLRVHTHPTHPPAYGLVCARVCQGITPILPIFREGILNGSAEVKESAAVGLTELIRRTSADALKPSVVNITGPLIRILGDRFGSGVKTAMLDTLTLLLSKVFITTSLHLTPYTTPNTKSCVRP